MDKLETTLTSFDKWLLSCGLDYHPDVAMAWQAAQQQSTGEIAELKADNERLRKALEDISNWTFGWDGDCGVTAVALQALAKTPEQCLIEHDNEVIERCAKAAENVPISGRKFVIDAIRALKG